MAPACPLQTPSFTNGNVGADFTGSKCSIEYTIGLDAHTLNDTVGNDSQSEKVKRILDGDGLVVHERKRPFRVATTHCLFEALDFRARLAGVVPRPRAHVIRYHGVFAPNPRHRALRMAKGGVVATGADEEPKAHASRPAMSWMQRLRGVYGIDVSACSNCAGDLNVLSVITQLQVIASILAHMAKREARAPPVGA